MKMYAMPSRSANMVWFVALVLLGTACKQESPPSAAPAPATQPAPAATNACPLPADMPPIEVPENRDVAEDLAAAANAHGSALLTAERPIEALMEFRKVQRLLPDRLEGLINEAIVYAHNGEAECRKLAREKFLDVIRHDPRQPHALYGLAIMAREDANYAEQLDFARRFEQQVPDDPYGLYLVGDALSELNQKQEAITKLEQSIRIDPEFSPSHYKLAREYQALAAGDPQAAKKAEEHSRIQARLRASGNSVRFWANRYTQHGPYAQAIPLFGLGSSGQIADAGTPVVFEEVSQAAGLTASPAPLDGPAGLAWLDYDNDGDVDLLVPGGISGGRPRSDRLWRNGQLSHPVNRDHPLAFFDATAQAGLKDLTGHTAAVAADWDRDGDTDLFLAGPNGCQVMVNSLNGFEEFPSRDRNGAAESKPAGPLPGGHGSDSWPGAIGQPCLEDVDHDGDEDLYLPGITGGGAIRNAFFRNISTFAVWQWNEMVGARQKQPASRFRDESKAWPVATDLQGVTGVLWTDIDGDVDSDAIVFGAFEPGLAVYLNMRENGFTPASKDTLSGWTAGHVVGATLADVDNNGFADLLVTRSQPPIINILSGHKRQFTPNTAIEKALPPEWRSASGIAAVDADNDGDLDILALVAEADETNPRLVLLRNDGLGRFSFDAKTGAWPLPAAGRVLAPADVDGDGRVDLAIRTADDRVLLMLNRTRNSGLYSANLRLLRSKPKSETDELWKFSCPTGAVVKVIAGRYAQLRRQATAGGYYSQGSPYMHLGLGMPPAGSTREAISAVEILWPSGVIQGLTTLTPQINGLVDIVELDARPASCPFLYVWDGRQYRFLGDVIAASPPGLYVAPGVYAECDPDEYIRIPENMLQPRDGAYDLVIHECLREVTYLDQVELLAVDHPEALTVYPNERFSGPPPFPENKLFAFDQVLAPSRAVEFAAPITEKSISHFLAFARSYAPVDCREALMVADDGKRVADFAHLDIPGFAAPHAIELEFDSVPADRQPVLLLHGYLKFPGSPAQYVAAERGLRFEMPRLERQATDGSWTLISPNIGAPAGYPRTITVDLAGKLEPGANRLRISTNIQVYWDWVRLGLAAPNAGLKVTRVQASSAVLSRSGFPRMLMPKVRGEPESYDFADQTSTGQRNNRGQTWRWPTMTGRYTGYGEVTELMHAADDRYAIFGAGEMVRVRFPAAALPPLASGMKRTFLVLTDGWVKDNYYQTAASNTVEPLPFHGMSDYPRGARDKFPWDDTHRTWDERFNSREVTDPQAF